MMRSIIVVLLLCWLGACGLDQTNDGDATIGCGDQQCSVGPQKCCVGEASSCAAAADTCFRDFAPSVELFCDDASDCEPQRCCVSQIGVDQQRYACSAQCELHEACVVGAACAEGLCVVDAAQASGARCDAAASIPCGGSSCSGAAPVCCWSTAGSCTELAAGSECSGAALRCTAGTCGELASCCLDGQGSSCATTCPDAAVALCASDADCPDKGGQPSLGCADRADGALPPGVRVCTY